ncbi:MAG: PEGA domain-containing protein [Phycisphaerales bacterium]
MPVALRVILVLSLAALGACGRQERTISVTSEPPGAMVWVNDVQLGRTPCESDFTFFGTYDVRLTLDGYEPIATSAEADAPFHEQPGIDLVAAALPGTRRTRIEWHYVLTPAAEAGGDANIAEDALMGRAKALRERAIASPAGAEAPSAPPAPPSTPPSSPPSGG